MLMKKAMIAADEWARINLYQRQIGDQNGEPVHWAGLSATDIHASVKHHEPALPSSYDA